MAKYKVEGNDTTMKQLLKRFESFRGRVNQSAQIGFGTQEIKTLYRRLDKNFGVDIGPEKFQSR